MTLKQTNIDKRQGLLLAEDFSGRDTDRQKKTIKNKVHEKNIIHIDLPVRYRNIWQ